MIAHHRLMLNVNWRAREPVEACVSAGDEPVKPRARSIRRNRRPTQSDGHPAHPPAAPQHDPSSQSMLRDSQQGMELNGASLNPSVKDDLLPRLAQLCGKTTSRRVRPLPPTVVKQRPVYVLETVKHVLGYADKPMRAKEIQATCEQLLGKPVSLPTILDILNRHCQKPDSLLVRPERGRYMLRVRPAPPKDQEVIVSDV